MTLPEISGPVGEAEALRLPEKRSTQISVRNSHEARSIAAVDGDDQSCWICRVTSASCSIRMKSARAEQTIILAVTHTVGITQRSVALPSGRMGRISELTSGQLVSVMTTLTSLSMPNSVRQPSLGRW